MNGKKSRIITIVVLVVLNMGFFFYVWKSGGTSPDTDGMYAFNVPTVAVGADDTIDDGSEENIAIEEVDVGAAVYFSEERYFLEENFELSLTATEDVVEIYYTLDSKPPQKDGTLYEKPIKMSSSSNYVKGYTIKACGRLGDGTYTQTYTHSYIVGDTVNERFDTLVFCLSTDPYNIYDYDYGIFVSGRLRDEYVKKSGNRNPDPPAPANYNLRGRDSERPVYVELIDQDGSLIFKQNAGMRVQGGWARAMPQKSIKLYARNEYEQGKTRFEYEFFPGKLNNGGMSITEYKSIVLRNNANDNPFGFLRDEAIQEMAGNTALDDVQGARAAAVFLNGEYYGFVWIKQVYGEEYLDDMNGIKNGEWAIIEGGETYKANDDNDPFLRSAIDDYYRMYHYPEKSYFTLEEFKKMVDLENLLTYYAVQIYVGNDDWPRGNYKAYKYFGDVAQSPYEDNTADGRWRWLIYDTDFGLGLYDKQPNTDTLGRLLAKSGEGLTDANMRSNMLIKLLEHEEVKKQFATILCDIMSWQFGRENLRDTIKRLEAERLNEVTNNFKYGGAQLKGSWSNMKYVGDQVLAAIKFGWSRELYMRNQMVKYLGLSKTSYEVVCNANENATIKINSCTMTSDGRDFKGTYYDICDLAVAAIPKAGYEVEYFVVNGRKIYSDEMLLTSRHVVDGTISIELVLKPSARAIPLITLVDYEKGNDYMVIHNPYDRDIDLGRYFISDNEGDLYRQRLAEYTLRPNEYLKLFCKGYSREDALGGFQVDFNLKNGETLYVTDMNKETVISLYLPKISNDRVLVYDGKEDAYRDVLRSSFE